MSLPEIPTDFTFGIDLPALEVDVSLNPVHITGDPSQPVAVSAQADIDVSLDPVRIIGDPKSPVAATADLGVDLKNLPHLSFDNLLELIETVKKLDIRLCLPLHLSFGISVFPLSLLGLDAVTFSICGETQFIAKKYVPNAYERCEVECEPCC
ncbi:MAG: hypothetical protein ACJ76J_13340 [Thermoanaerobaculia bacterium]